MLPPGTQDSDVRELVRELLGGRLSWLVRPGSGPYAGILRPMRGAWAAGGKREPIRAAGPLARRTSRLRIVASEPVGVTGNCEEIWISRVRRSLSGRFGPFPDLPTRLSGHGSKGRADSVVGRGDGRDIPSRRPVTVSGAWTAVRLSRQPRAPTTVAPVSGLSRPLSAFRRDKTYGDGSAAITAVPVISAPSLTR
jgi:hypothetical protein